MSGRACCARAPVRCSASRSSAAQIATAVLTSLVAVSGVRALHRVLLVGGAVLLNALVIAAVYRWLCVRRFSWREVAPGAVAAGLTFAALQIAGTVVVGRAISKASPIYGTFASVIALVTWLSLHALVALVGAELNHALPARRYR